jgi:hypothetical protein
LNPRPSGYEIEVLRLIPFVAIHDGVRKQACHQSGGDHDPASFRLVRLRTVESTCSSDLGESIFISIRHRPPACLIACRRYVRLMQDLALLDAIEASSTTAQKVTLG